MRIESRRHKIHYLTVGRAGRAIVLVHGHLQAAEDWARAGYLDLLEGSHRVVAIDMLGYGESDKPRDVVEHALDGRVADIAAVLDAEGIDEAVFWGYSLGVFSAEAFAKQHPERTTALVAGGNMVGFSPEDRANICVAGAAELERVGLDEYLKSWTFLQPETAELFARRNDALAAGAAARGSALRHLGDDAPLPRRTLNYAGTAEPWFEIAAAVARERGADFAGVPGADHSGAFQRSADVVQLVVEFLGSA